MLSSSFFQSKIDSDLIKKIFLDFHINGPIDNNHLESLAYMKKFYPNEFTEYEGKLMFLMGLFYKTQSPNTFLETIYNTYAQTILAETGHQFTPIQANAYTAIKTHTNFSFSAPTSAGKSFLFQQLIKETHGDIIIILPSRALISEYLIKIKQIVSKETLVLQFVEVVNTKKTKNRIYILTPERGEEIFKNVDKLNLELILLDEAQISEDGIRGMRFDSLVRRIDKKLGHVKKVFTHPFILNPEAQFTKHNIINNTNYATYNQKTVGKIYIEYFQNTFKYFSPFEDGTKGELVAPDIVKDVIKSNGTVLIYISKNNIYQNNYFEKFSQYIDLCPEIVDTKATAYISQLEMFLGTKDDESKYSNLISLMKKGIVIHHGSIPLKARLIIEEFVNGNYAKICFSTSTLIQGINMPFDIIWIDNFRFTGSDDKKILDLKNLIGRAGRTTLEDASFDYGYVIVSKKNKKSFMQRLQQESVLSSISVLDDERNSNQEDFIDIIDAIKNDTFNPELQLTESQIKRISEANIDESIALILNSLLNQEGTLLTARAYYNLEKPRRKSIKDAFQNIYKAHLRRTELSSGEKGVLDTAIPILLWQIQGKSFAEIVSLRYAFLAQKELQNQLKRENRASELERVKVRFSCVAESLPNKSLKRSIPLFKQGTSILNVDFDKIVYDTYDYIDKVLSLSIKDPLSSAFLLYFQDTNDFRAKTMSNLIRYGTDNETEIWMLKYGFSFEEIEILIEYIEKIDETEIVFKGSISDFIKDSNNFKLVERYL
ncbi:DEAD/DEAH box helicase [Flexibacter flexilis DSM 6793]|uniref:DEAD/DEAH box helicase n=1 Tax=Flexibacter flexilis DSM 6793 TaxID=927664 RepID=A0A1I1NWZ6_9BACT|nr:DEAD/DEAH box helicase [Flexibacter flexilis]SFD02119.1 DEAD/DEAH box helicase [Flexibacter flexilis DSM 6793]